MVCSGLFRHEMRDLRRRRLRQISWILYALCRRSDHRIFRSGLSRHAVYLPAERLGSKEQSSDIFAVARRVGSIPKAPHPVYGGIGIDPDKKQMEPNENA